MPDAAVVIERICTGSYAGLFSDLRVQIDDEHDGEAILSGEAGTALTDAGARRPRPLRVGSSWCAGSSRSWTGWTCPGPGRPTPR